MAIMELKLVQEIAIIDHDPLFLVLLDIRKEYGTVDRERLIHSLEGYSAGPPLWRLLESFWGHQKEVPK